MKRTETPSQPLADSDPPATLVERWEPCPHGLVTEEDDICNYTLRGRSLLELETETSLRVSWREDDKIIMRRWLADSKITPQQLRNRFKTTASRQEHLFLPLMDKMFIRHDLLSDRAFDRFTEKIKSSMLYCLKKDTDKGLATQAKNESGFVEMRYDKGIREARTHPSWTGNHFTRAIVVLDENVIDHGLKAGRNRPSTRRARPRDDRELLEDLIELAEEADEAEKDEERVRKTARQVQNHQDAGSKRAQQAYQTRNANQANDMYTQGPRGNGHDIPIRLAPFQDVQSNYRSGCNTPFRNPANQEMQRPRADGFGPSSHVMASRPTASPVLMPSIQIVPPLATTAPAPPQPLAPSCAQSFLPPSVPPPSRNDPKVVDDLAKALRDRHQIGLAMLEHRARYSRDMIRSFREDLASGKTGCGGNFTKRSGLVQELILSEGRNASDEFLREYYALARRYETTSQVVANSVSQLQLGAVKQLMVNLNISQGLFAPDGLFGIIQPFFVF